MKYLILIGIMVLMIGMTYGYTYHSAESFFFTNETNRFNYNPFLDISYLRYDGTLNTTSISPNITINISAGITLSAWFNASSRSSGGMRLINLINSSNANPNIYLDLRDASGKTKGDFRIIINTSCDVTVNTGTVYSLNDSKWHNLIGTYNGTTLTIYLDGERLQQIGFSAMCVNLSRERFSSYSTYKVGIGAVPTGGGNWNGSISEIKIYNISTYGIKNRIILNKKFNQIGIPVFMYHEINDSIPVPNIYRINTSNFKEQLDYLNKSNFTTITFIDYYQYMRNNFTLPLNPIILTFDDGYTSQYLYAAKLMKNYSFKGVIGINIDYINNGNNGYSGYETIINWSNVNDLIMNYSWEIASHSYNHSSFLSLNHIERNNNFNQSKLEIYNKTGIYPITFIFPSNSQNISIQSECNNYYSFCTADESSLGGTTSDTLFYGKKSIIFKGITRIYATNSTNVYSKSQYSDILPFNLFDHDFGLVRYYNFNEGQGNNLTDLSPNKQNATIFNCTWSRTYFFINTTNHDIYANLSYLNTDLLFVDNFTYIDFGNNDSRNITFFYNQSIFILNNYNITKSISRQYDPLYTGGELINNTLDTALVISVYYPESTSLTGIF